MYPNQVKHNAVRSLGEIDVLVQKSSLVLTVHKTLVIDWLTYVQNIFWPSFVGPFDIVRPDAFAYKAYAIIRPCQTSFVWCTALTVIQIRCERTARSGRNIPCFIFAIVRNVADVARFWRGSRNPRTPNQVMEFIASNYNNSVSLTCIITDYFSGPRWVLGPVCVSWR